MATAPSLAVASAQTTTEEAPAASSIAARAQPVASGAVGDPPLVLRITAVDSSGRDLATGTVHVAHALRGLGDPADRREIVLRDIALPVDVEIPPDRRRAELTVSAPGHRPAFESIGQLRVLDGRWLTEDERHVREVRVRLERERNAVERVFGRVRVDGRPRLPRGLRIDVRSGSLLPSSAGLTGDESAARASSPSAIPPPTSRSARTRALLDPYALEYEAEVVCAGPHVLSITSEETVPQSIEFVVPPDLASLQRDLDLASGVRLEVVAARSRERTRIEGLEVRLEHVQIEAETSEFRLRRTHSLLAATRADGIARFAGLPPGARVKVSATLSEVGRAPRDGLAEVDLPLDPAGVVTCRLWVGGPSPDACELYGSLDSAWLAGGSAEALRVAWQEVGRPESQQRRPIGADSWAFPSNPDRDLAVWIEREGRRITERSSVRTRAGRLGPVRFAPADVSELRVSWTGAPIGWELQLLTGELPAGAARSPKRRIGAARGEEIVQRFADADVSVLATSPAGSRWYQSWPGTSLGNEFAFEFQPCRPVEIEADPGVLGDLTALSLWSLAPEGGAETSAVRVALRDGRGVESVPLATGAHFFRGETSGVACWVAGSATVRPGGCRAAWRGSPLSIAARIERGELGFVLSTCAHGDLGAVPIAERRFRFDDLRTLVSRPETLLVDAEGCGFLPLHSP